MQSMVDLMNCLDLYIFLESKNPVSILHKSIAGRYRRVRIADGPITARCRFMKNASWEQYSYCIKLLSDKFDINLEKAG